MVKFSHVSAGYADPLPFLDFSWELPETGTVAVTGPSGCGKTTLLMLLCGLLAPRSGEISGLLGKKISIQFQEDRLLPWYSAEKNIALISGEAAATHWLGELELGQEDAKKLPRALSGGMRRRVSLARAMAFGGDLLLLDEPFKGLDDALKARVIERISGVFPLTVLVTHDEREAAAMGAKSLLRLTPPR